MGMRSVAPSVCVGAAGRGERRGGAEGRGVFGSEGPLADRSQGDEARLELQVAVSHRPRSVEEGGVRVDVAHREGRPQPERAGGEAFTLFRRYFDGRRVPSSGVSAATVPSGKSRV